MNMEWGKRHGAGAWAGAEYEGDMTTLRMRLRMRIEDRCGIHWECCAFNKFENFLLHFYDCRWSHFYIAATVACGTRVA